MGEMRWTQVTPQIVEAVLVSPEAFRFEVRVRWMRQYEKPLFQAVVACESFVDDDSYDETWHSFRAWVNHCHWQAAKMAASQGGH